MDKQEDNNLYSVAFLDLLGFSNFTKMDLNASTQMLEDYNYIIKQDSLEEKKYQKSINHFDFFLPFSDSIFIGSKQRENLLNGLCKFLSYIWYFKVHFYAFPDNPSKIFEFKNIDIYIKKGEIIQQKELFYNEYPLLFRGGISYGNISVVNSYHKIPNDFITNKINAKETTQNNNSVNLLGAPISNSVSYEKKSKGPRFICDSDFYNGIEDSYRKFFEKRKNDLYEFIWPALFYMKFSNWNSKKEEINLFIANEFDIWISSVVNLWKYHVGDIAEEHYYEYLHLLNKSFKIVMDEISNSNFEREIKNLYKKNDMDDVIVKNLLKKLI